MQKGETIVSGELMTYSARTESVQMVQSAMIARMLEKNGKDYLQVSESQYGAAVRCNGCTGHIRYTNMQALNMVERFDGLKNYTDREIELAMLIQVFGLEVISPIANLLEFFFRLFLFEVSGLTKRGLRSEYQKIRTNGTQFKGKILFSENIRKNYIHKERVFVEYSKYTLDRVENRILKKALLTVGGFTTDAYNKALVMSLIKYFDEVETSERPKFDFGKVKITKDSEDYIMPLKWARTILVDMGLTEHTGMKKPIAVLMDSKDLLAAYVASKAVEDRKNGRFEYDYTVEKIKGPSTTDPVIMIIKPIWSFYDKTKGREVSDPEYLFNTASGYAVMPSSNDADPTGERILASMAEQYLNVDLYELVYKKGTGLT